MSDFDRYIIPNFSSYPEMPEGAESWGHSGAGQFRDMQNKGRTWQEKYPPIKYDDENARKFFAYVNDLWRSKTIFTIVHRHMQTPRGTISGTPTVNGAYQTGRTITVSAITGTLKFGDIIKFENINVVYDVMADVANGGTSISISPPIFEGGSPAHGASITYTSVPFRAVLSGMFAMPACEADQIYSGLVLGFRECP